MQGLSPKSGQGFAQLVAGASRGMKPPAIDRIAKQGVLEPGHVHADLVGAAGFQPHID